jgi:hypothetical protein
MLVLDFLQISQPVGKTHFLQHITELIHVKLEKGDTYNSVFSKLRERMKNESAERTQAAEDWITFNLEAQKDNPAVFETIISEDDEEFAVFNLRKKS